MKKSNVEKETLYKIELVFIISLIVALPLIFFKPSITGFVSSDIQRTPLNLTLEESKIIQMHTQSNQSVALDYLSMSGEIIGDGDVAVYLSNGKDKLLIYSNMGKPSKPNLITGFATGPTASGKGKFNDDMILEIGESLQWPGDMGFSTGGGSFGRTCLETCFLDPQAWTNNTWQILAYVQPGTKLKITEISFTVSQ